MSDGLYLVDPVQDAKHVAACLAQGGFVVLSAGAVVARESGSKVRKVEPISLVQVTPATATGERPKFVMADPKALLVDETYQRNLSDRSLRMIRKIITEWDWRKFSPPVAAETGRGLELIDGQHTAIAAASHPTLGHIPVMVVKAPTQADRARAFVSHNTDRLGMTAMQLHFAAVAGGVASAIRVDQVARNAGVKILRVNPAGNGFKPRETLAVAAIDQVVRKRGDERAVEILKVLADADLAPINAGQIKAIDFLLADEDHRDQVTPAGLTKGLGAIRNTWAGEAGVFAATQKVPVWRGMAAVLFRRAKERRRAGVGE